MVEKTEQIVREAPEVEAYKLGLLESAKKLADQGITLPKQQVAGMSGLQQEAFQQAQAGIDSFKPYLQEAGYTLGDAQAAFDPSGIGAFMNPFQQAVQDEINRAYDIQAQQAALGAVGQPGRTVRVWRVTGRDSTARDRQKSDLGPCTSASRGIYERTTSAACNRRRLESVGVTTGCLGRNRSATRSAAGWVLV